MAIADAYACGQHRKTKAAFPAHAMDASCIDGIAKARDNAARSIPVHPLPK